MAYPVTEAAYELLSEVGKGATATVFRGMCLPLQEEVAVKIINLDNTMLEVEQFQREIAIMSKSSHVNVVKLHSSFSQRNCLWLILDYYPYGSVADVLRHSGGLKDHEDLIVALLYQSLQALHYFHANGQMHRDVKAANLLLSENGYIAMADFGVSAEAPACRGSVARQTFVGTPCWMAPEILTRKGYRKTADIWSLGITALEMAFSKPPLAAFPPMKVMAITLRGDPPSVDKYGCPNRLSQEFKNFVDQCLNKNPAKRPSAQELLDGPLFRHITSSEHAAEIAKKCLSAMGLKPLTHKPVEEVPTIEAVVDWAFPSTIGGGSSAESDGEQWRSECAHSHKVSSARYTKGNIIETHSRLTTYRATMKQGNSVVALHEIECDAGSYNEQIFSPGAIETILSIQHEGLLQCMEVWENGEDRACYVTEAKEHSSIGNHLTCKGPFSETTAIKHAKVIGQGLELLHSLGIMHRRVMPHSVFITADGNVKLGAVMSTLLPASHKYVSMRQVDPPGGVEAYLASEQFEDDFDEKVDIYAYGLLLLEMLTARPPYQEAKNPMKLVQLKTQGIPPDSLTTLTCSAPLKNLIERCINPVSSQRPSISDVLQILSEIQ